MAQLSWIPFNAKDAQDASKPAAKDAAWIGDPKLALRRVAGAKDPKPSPRPTDEAKEAKDPKLGLRPVNVSNDPRQAPRPTSGVGVKPAADANVTTEVKEAIGVTPVADANVTTEVKEAIGVTPVADANVTTEVKEAIGVTPVADANVTTEVKEAIGVTPVADANVTTEVKEERAAEIGSEPSPSAKQSAAMLSAQTDSAQMGSAQMQSAAMQSEEGEQRDSSREPAGEQRESSCEPGVPTHKLMSLSTDIPVPADVPSLASPAEMGDEAVPAPMPAPEAAADSAAERSDAGDVKGVDVAEPHDAAPSPTEMLVPTDDPSKTSPAAEEVQAVELLPTPPPAEAVEHPKAAAKEASRPAPRQAVAAPRPKAAGGRLFAAALSGAGLRAGGGKGGGKGKAATAMASNKGAGKGFSRPRPSPLGLHEQNAEPKSAEEVHAAAKKDFLEVVIGSSGPPPQLLDDSDSDESDSEVAEPVTKAQEKQPCAQAEAAELVAKEQEVVACPQTLSGEDAAKAAAEVGAGAISGEEAVKAAAELGAGVLLKTPPEGAPVPNLWEFLAAQKRESSQTSENGEDQPQKRESVQSAQGLESDGNVSPQSSEGPVSTSKAEPEYFTMMDDSDDEVDLEDDDCVGLDDMYSFDPVKVAEAVKAGAGFKEVRDQIEQAMASALERRLGAHETEELRPSCDQDLESRMTPVEGSKSLAAAAELSSSARRSSMTRRRRSSVLKKTIEEAIEGARHRKGAGQEQEAEQPTQQESNVESLMTPTSGAAAASDTQAAEAQPAQPRRSSVLGRSRRSSILRRTMEAAITDAKQRKENAHWRSDQEEAVSVNYTDVAARQLRRASLGKTMEVLEIAGADVCTDESTETIAQAKLIGEAMVAAQRRHRRSIAKVVQQIEQAEYAVPPPPAEEAAVALPEDAVPPPPAQDAEATLAAETEASAPGKSKPTELEARIQQAVSSAWHRKLMQGRQTTQPDQGGLAEASSMQDQSYQMGCASWAEDQGCQMMGGATWSEDQGCQMMEGATWSEECYQDQGCQIVEGATWSEDCYQEQGCQMMDASQGCQMMGGASWSEDQGCQTGATWSEGGIWQQSQPSAYGQQQSSYVGHQSAYSQPQQSDYTLQQPAAYGMGDGATGQWNGCYAGDCGSWQQPSYGQQEPVYNGMGNVCQFQQEPVYNGMGNVTAQPQAATTAAEAYGDSPCNTGSWATSAYYSPWRQGCA